MTMRFRQILNHLEEWLIGFLLALTTGVIFVAVVHRYLSGVPIPYLQDWLLARDFGWAQEFALICAAWMAKIGAAYGVRTGIHVGVDIVTERATGKTRELLVTLGLGAGILFSALTAWFGALFVWENGLAYAFYDTLGWDTGPYFEGSVTPDLEWPSWAVYLIIPIGGMLMGWRFLEVLIRFWRTGDLPRHQVAHVAGLEES